MAGDTRIPGQRQRTLLLMAKVLASVSYWFISLIHGLQVPWGNAGPIIDACTCSALCCKKNSWVWRIHPLFSKQKQVCSLSSEKHYLIPQVAC